MSQDLNGKVALVTGASRGIGAAVARELAAQGAQLIVSARRLDSLSETLKACPGARTIACDLSQPDQIESLIEQVDQVDILVNNAGQASSAPLKRLKLDEFHQLLQVNLTSALRLTQAFVPGMLVKNWGRVVNVASVAGLTGGKYIAAYSTSKHALVGLTRSLAAEFCATGLTINAICPGFVDTPMTDQSVERIVALGKQNPEQAREQLAKLNASGRLVEAQEVAFAVAFLCHPRAGSIHGQSLVIDGGGYLS